MRREQVAVRRVSNVDLQVDVDDGHVAATFGAVEAALAALGSYHRYLLAPLVTLYRVRHTPARHDFGSRYTRDDLPSEVQETLAELSFVADLDDLAAKLSRAGRLLRELCDELG